MRSLPMEQCPSCEKKMPKHILVKHIAKRHSQKEVTTSTTGVAMENVKVVTTPVVTDWNWGEINVCQQCKEKWPSRLMELHMSVRHGL